MEINSYSTWLEIDLNAITQNVAYIKRMTGVEVMAVIKANGYGHGARPAAQAAVQGGATWCGVARIEEAAQLIPLKNIGISTQCGFASTEEGNILTEEELDFLKLLR